ncbi:MAG: ornithine cyclodeaminase family protein [Pseudomonadota bacterium]
MISLTQDQIEPLIDWAAATDAIRQAYVDASAGRVSLPPVGHITFPDVGGDCHIKYGHVLGQPSFVIKVATGFPKNADHDMPNGNGLVLVMSAQTGVLQAILHDQMLLTDVRTGLGGGVAAQALARPDAQRLLVVGSSVQAQWQIKAHVQAMPGLDQITLWGRNPNHAKTAVKAMREKATIQIADDLETATRTADIIVTATGATAPLIQSDWIQPGTHVTAVGADAPGKQELDPALVARATVVTVDSMSQCLNHGEVSHAVSAGFLDPSRIVELGTLLSDPSLGRQTDQDITVTDLTGIAAQDIAIANCVLQSYSPK